MPHQEPWVMAVQAGAAAVSERDRVARSLESRVPTHPDWILLSTCHRVELYGFGPVPELDEGLHLEKGHSAVTHLIRVAAGLESAIVGEDEVLHQVREALSDARAARQLDSRLQRLFETAIAAGRRARGGRTAASGNLAQSAVAWLQRNPGWRAAPCWSWAQAGWVRPWLIPPGWPDHKSPSPAAMRQGRTAWRTCTEAGAPTSPAVPTWRCSRPRWPLLSPAPGTIPSQCRASCLLSPTSQRPPL